MMKERAHQLAEEIRLNNIERVKLAQERQNSEKSVLQMKQQLAATQAQEKTAISQAASLQTQKAALEKKLVAARERLTDAEKNLKTVKESVKVKDL